MVNLARTDIETNLAKLHEAVGHACAGSIGPQGLMELRADQPEASIQPTPLIARDLVHRVCPTLMRLFCKVAIHFAYRFETRGLEHIPREGAALLACNHVSFIDALVILAASPRPIRFLVDSEIYRIPALSPIFSTCNAIPIAPAKEDAALLARAYDEVAKALEAGELVAIFPEGRITDSGEMFSFRGGVSRIIERTPVPVVPLAIKGMWGSFFSRHAGAAMTKPFCRGAFSRIGLEARASLLPGHVTPEGLQHLIATMRGAWW